MAFWRGLNDEQRRKLKLALGLTAILGDICKELNLTRFQVQRELKYGLSENDFKNKLWINYDPELSIKNQLREYEVLMRYGEGNNE